MQSLLLPAGLSGLGNSRSHPPAPFLPWASPPSQNRSSSLPPAQPRASPHGPQQGCRCRTSPAEPSLPGPVTGLTGGGLVVRFRRQQGPSPPPRAPCPPTCTPGGAQEAPRAVRARTPQPAPSAGPELRVPPRKSGGRLFGLAGRVSPERGQTPPCHRPAFYGPRPAHRLRVSLPGQLFQTVREEGRPRVLSLWSSGKVCPWLHPGGLGHAGLPKFCACSQTQRLLRPWVAPVACSRENGQTVGPGVHGWGGGTHPGCLCSGSPRLP